MNIPVGAFSHSKWNHVTVTRVTSDKWSCYIDGILVVSLDDASDIGDFAGELLIGTGTSGPGTEDPYRGYMDEIRFIKGAYLPPRFYLGNQTPESGGSLTAFKYVDLEKTSSD